MNKGSQHSHQSLKHLAIVIFLMFYFAFSSGAQKVKLLYFGWDYPSAVELEKNISTMQDKPFDGICFSLQSDPIESFDVDNKSKDYFCYEKLEKVKWGRFTDNYIFMRGMSKTGGSWLDDKAWDAITKNMEGISKVLKLEDVKGILFDPEYYYPDNLKNPWTYSKEQYPNYSFKKMQNIVRKRGRQFIEALQKETNNFSILSIWMASLAATETASMPLEKSKHALLLSFMEGILLYKHKEVTIIDGNETAYWYSTPSQFLETQEKLQSKTKEMMSTKKAKMLVPNIQISQPVFYNGIMASSKEYDRGFENNVKWNWLEENMKLAIASSTSKLVWVYFEERNFWKQKLNDTLNFILTNPFMELSTPAQSRVKQKENNLTESKLSNFNSGLGVNYILKPGYPSVQGNIAFDCEWNSQSGLLKIVFKNELPVSLSIFLNGEMILKQVISQTKVELMLKKYSTGVLTVLAKYKDGKQAYSSYYK